MVYFTDRYGGLRSISIFNLKSYCETTMRKNNINKTDLGKYKHLKRRNFINNLVYYMNYAICKRQITNIL